MFEEIIGNGIFRALAGGGDVSLTHLAGTTVAGSAVTSIAFSGLSLSNRAGYLVVGRIVNPTVSAPTYSVRVNSDATATNYYNQIVQANNSALAGFRTNTNQFSRALASAKTAFVAQFVLTGDRVEWFADTIREDDAGMITERGSGVHAVANTNLTDLEFVSSVASAIGVGSRIDIYALEQS